MAVRTDITLERTAGGPPIQATVGPDNTTFAVTQSTHAALPFADKSHEPIKNSVEAVSQLAGILKKDHKIDSNPNGNTSIQVAGTDTGFAVMAAKLFQVNGAIGEDQVNKFEARLKSAERAPEPVIAAASAQPVKAGLLSQLETISAALGDKLKNMKDIGNDTLASSKENSGAALQVDAVAKGSLRTT